MKLSTQTNAGWLYEKAYFFGLDWSGGDRSSTNEQALKTRNKSLQRIQFSPPPAPFGKQALSLQTTYPGLLTGSGYPHEMGFEGELKLGFSFEYATGLPYLPGSSVKGTLRSLFQESENKPTATALLTELICKVTGESGPPHAPQSESGIPLLTQLREEMFTNQLVQSEGSEFVYEARPSSQRDIFYDAFVQAGTQTKVIGTDYITPHLNRKAPAYDSLTEPIPIPFLIIMPEVSIRFDFDLKDSQVWPALTASKKVELFQEILVLMGIGAKTRVGYGKLVNPQAKPEVPKPSPLEPRIPQNIPQGRGRAQKGGKQPYTPPKPRPVVPQEINTDELPDVTFAQLRTASRRGGRIIGMVKDNANGQLILAYKVDGELREATIRYAGSSSIKLGTRIRLTVKSPGTADLSQQPVFGFGGYDR